MWAIGNGDHMHTTQDTWPMGIARVTQEKQLRRHRIANKEQRIWRYKNNSKKVIQNMEGNVSAKKTVSNKA